MRSGSLHIVLEQPTEREHAFSLRLGNAWGGSVKRREVEHTQSLSLSDTHDLDVGTSYTVTHIMTPRRNTLTDEHFEMLLLLQSMPTKFNS